MVGVEDIERVDLKLEVEVQSVITAGTETEHSRIYTSFWIRLGLAQQSRRLAS
jgi:hypothetical protein